MTGTIFTQGVVYNRRRDIHGPFGGQQYGGICTPAKHPFIFIFTGEIGEAHGYADGWTEAGTYRYFGEGQVGDMEFKSGNRAIRDHFRNGKDILMFQILGKGQVRCMGQFVCCGHSYEQAPDHDGNQRQAIVFALIPAGDEIDAEIDRIEQIESVSEDMADLRVNALAAAQDSPNSKGHEARRQLYRRSEVVRRYVLARADGICEECGALAPFTSTRGLPYLEPHHIRRLTDGGPDDPRFMAALCPNCHCEIHHGVDGSDKNRRLQKLIDDKESDHEI